MKVNVISYEPKNGWILYDYAAKLNDSLRKIGVHSELTFEQHKGFDVTFHVNYWGLKELKQQSLHTTLVTHIDTNKKKEIVNAHSNSGVVGFCMSDETERMLKVVTGNNNFFSLAPPAMVPSFKRKIKLLIANRLYPDGRKNEAWIIDFIKCFDIDNIEIKIIGSGWEGHIEKLNEQKYLIEYFNIFNKNKYVELLREAEYLLVVGFDEGAIATMDALAMGVKPIVSAQGYHLHYARDLILFKDYYDLINIAQEMNKDIEETHDKSKDLADWDLFAIKHRDIWSRLLANI